MRIEKSGISRTVATAVILALAVAAALPRVASAETMLRIGMTAADIPRTLGQPDQGFEGNRFTGLTMYDALTMWDLSSADKAERRDSRARDRVESRRLRQEEMDLQAAPRRHLP